MGALTKAGERRRLINQVKQCDLAAAYRLAEDMKPPSVPEFVIRVVPAGRLSPRLFDCLADAWAEWRRAVRERGE